ncbi:flagellar biosynthesis anti-sigma factor FlgM [Thiorhodococcus fuscus]|uniref:Negative regulator of flagellin synthesis n=1 Tax=Thiorhodococcus fuscus TaxID=527200 RepID=A0ABW4YAX5_9GAMM
MDIKNLLSSSTRLPEATSTGSSTRVGNRDSNQSDAAHSPSTDSLTITQTARVLNAAMEGAKTVPYDSDKVESIKAALAEGSYPIDNTRLAESILDAESLA